MEIISNWLFENQEKSKDDEVNSTPDPCTGLVRIPVHIFENDQCRYLLNLNYVKIDYTNSL